jgi:hypothetical protein
VRAESLRFAVRSLARPIAGGEEIHGHGDLHHLPPVNRKLGTVVAFAL